MKKRARKKENVLFIELTAFGACFRETMHSKRMGCQKPWEIPGEATVKGTWVF
jgi:hypothetical protein